jgi:hypothetical protein
MSKRKSITHGLHVKRKVYAVLSHNVIIFRGLYVKRKFYAVLSHNVIICRDLHVKRKFYAVLSHNVIICRGLHVKRKFYAVLSHNVIICRGLHVKCKVYAVLSHNVIICTGLQVKRKVYAVLSHNVIICRGLHVKRKVYAVGLLSQKVIICIGGGEVKSYFPLIYYQVSSSLVTFLKFSYGLYRSLMFYFYSFDKRSLILSLIYYIFLFLKCLLASRLTLPKIYLFTSFLSCNHCSLACSLRSDNFKHSLSNNGLLCFDSQRPTLSLAENLMFSQIVSHALLCPHYPLKFFRAVNLFLIVT